MKHARVKVLLYEYVRGELPPDEAAAVIAHLAACTSCAGEERDLRKLLTLTSERFSAPSGERPPAYWKEFASAVERRIPAAVPRRNARPVSIADSIAAFFSLRPRSTAAFGGALAVAVVALVYFSIFRVRPAAPQESARIEQQPAPAVLASNQMGDYFRRSKVLLVGISHLKPDQDEPVDLSRESRESRELLEESRSIKDQPLDIRSARLMDDLQKILIELANIKQEGGLPNVEIIRSGMQRENLLFKIRIAEALCDSTRFVPVRDSY